MAGIQAFKGFMEGIRRALPERAGGRRGQAPGESAAIPEEPSIVQVVNSFILEAVRAGASDVHIEPGEGGLSIRLRIDGLLHRVSSPPRETQPLILSRLKILAGMDIAERRLPQDGRMDFSMEGQGEKEEGEGEGGTVNIRVSTLPTCRGEKMVLRLLNRERIIMDLDRLGMNEKNLAAFKGIIRASHGLLLVTGPTGCGKSTTLYSAINHLNSPEKNIITVEDPVEFFMKGVNQVQTNARIGLTFGQALRNILRQDPNIIMIGEIRDAETAEIATRAALTGHLVLSTLHTNDAPRAITRLLDMGVKEYLLVSSLVGIVAQRLVRLLCPRCRELGEVTPAERELLLRFFPAEALPAALYRARGCPRCSSTGYRGRLALHEVLPCSEGMKGLILKGAPVRDLERQARQEGMIPLSRDGVEKALQGLTTLSEVIRAASNGVFE